MAASVPQSMGQTGARAQAPTLSSLTGHSGHLCGHHPLQEKHPLPTAGALDLCGGLLSPSQAVGGDLKYLH